ncbi:unnamed protein product [Darwinula stevensoni]|uniref:Uncharacterized protein n=1 Tax=Darwinula stevensoni TaxID=69355 RepID=A0A7R8X191_9CRUS|nr:unnamed protein product [Darwinula stevensoni]CAG0879990.1 unnamed protein product [Darwinula stevensoni]
MHRENITVVNVYYENVAVEKIVENQLYPWTSFIGMLGGMLGLYTGLSFVSILEMLEWILDLILYGWRKPRKENMGPRRRGKTTKKERESRERRLYVLALLGEMITSQIQR